MLLLRPSRLPSSLWLLGLLSACAQHGRDAAPMTPREGGGDAAAITAEVDAAETSAAAPLEDVPRAEAGETDSASPHADAGDAGLGEVVTGACGEFARLPGASGFGAAPCGQVVPWVSPTFVYAGARSEGPGQAVPLKGGDGIVVAAHFHNPAAPRYRTVFARVDEQGNCQELIGQVEDDDDRQYVLQAQASARGSVLITGCNYGFCGPTLRLAGAAPYDLLRDLGIDALLSSTTNPPRLFQRVVSARDDAIVVASTAPPELAVDAGPSSEPAGRLVLRTLSPDLQLMKSATVPVRGTLNDVALTDEGELLVLVERENEAGSHSLYRYGPALQERGQVYKEFRNFHSVALEAAFGRVAFALNSIVILDTHTYAQLPFQAQFRPSDPFGGFALFEDGGTLYASSEVLSLYAPDGSPRWSRLVPRGPTGAFLSRSVVQVQSSGRIVFSSLGQLNGDCE